MVKATFFTLFAFYFVVEIFPSVSPPSTHLDLTMESYIETKKTC